jgi:hypothetical protein
MIDHELRHAISDELHGRPGLPVSAPARIMHLAFTLQGDDPDPASPGAPALRCAGREAAG